MNMHGFMTPAGQADEQEIGMAGRAWAWIVERRWLLGVVVLPTLLVALYLFAYASDQYESEAHFLVRSSAGSVAPAAGVSAVIGMVTGSSGASNEATSVADYLTSHDAVERLRHEDRLVDRFRRPGVDLLSRLTPANPTPERLLRYFRKQVAVKYHSDTGITVVEVRSFNPQDSYDIARKLIQIGEERVNMLNTRSYTDAIDNARRQLADAEAALAISNSQMTAFRRNRGDIDPQASGQAQLGIVSNLTSQVAQARAQLNAMGGMISHSSPQYQALAAHVAALQAQLGAQNGRLAGGSRAIANDISGFQALEMRRGFLAKRYEAAAAGLERALQQAQEQQLYLVRVVDANMPVKALFPERWRILLTVVISLLLVYSIGWLIAAGVREHAA
ncbi:lipopolysaccharide biosynthesis protein [Sphingomonas crusticola]|uniref:lipopolysaccharide biosynthesis protein n=1 Tax=Sphingomonas crusticola TaxID=1697973 RepID=UPI001F07B83D|nr:lipopolysaccharide biosynthesis protein [Sphingomonas crusticola]